MPYPRRRTTSWCPAACLVWLALASPAGAGQLVLDPNNVNFGDVELVSPPVARTLRIVNHGSPTTIFGFDEIAGCTEFKTIAAGLPRVLGDADTLVVEVDYDPTGRGPDACAMQVHDDNGVSDILGLTGDGIAPFLAVSDTALAYRLQAFSLGVPETLWVTLQNQGNETIQAPHFTASFQSGVDFHVGTVTLPIAPNTLRVVPVVFHPASAGTKNDWLTFTVDNAPPSDGIRVLHLSGTWAATTAVGDPPIPEAGLRLAPTPARGSVRLTFDAPRRGRASIEICDVTGRTIARVERRVEGAGSVTTTLRAGADWSPEPGVYLALVRFEGRTIGAKRLVVLR